MRFAKDELKDTYFSLLQIFFKIFIQPSSFVEQQQIGQDEEQQE
jgi:hypothetical protein